MVADQDDSCDEGRLELQVEEGERLNQASGFTEALSGHHLYIPAQCAADLMEFVRIVKVGLRPIQDALASPNPHLSPFF